MWCNMHMQTAVAAVSPPTLLCCETQHHSPAMNAAREVLKDTRLERNINRSRTTLCATHGSVYYSKEVDFICQPVHAVEDTQQTGRPAHAAAADVAPLGTRSPPYAHPLSVYTLASLTHMVQCRPTGHSAACQAGTLLQPLVLLLHADASCPGTKSLRRWRRKTQRHATVASPAKRTNTAAGRLKDTQQTASSAEATHGSTCQASEGGAGAALLV